jgi:hypothetical protein
MGNGPAGTGGDGGAGPGSGPGGTGGNAGGGDDPISRNPPREWIPHPYNYTPMQLGGTPSGNYGGTANTGSTLGGAPTGTYQTQAPNYANLTAKHQTGYKDQAGETQQSNMFNYNGTVYRFDPDSENFTDTYTGNTIRPGSEDTGSQGIAGIYGQLGNAHELYGSGDGPGYEQNPGGLEQVAKQKRVGHWSDDPKYAIDPIPLTKKEQEAKDLKDKWMRGSDK